jgi:hypothetical protein
MSLSMRRTTAASVLILSVGLGTSVQASASPGPVAAQTGPVLSHAATPPSAAQVGAGWVGHQFTGKDIVTGGSPDPSSTVQAVLAFAASGAGGAKAHAAIAWLKKNFESYVTISGVDQPGSLAYVILAAQALGVDPTAFGGKKAANNLIGSRPPSARRAPTPDCSAPRIPASTVPSGRACRSWPWPIRASPTRTPWWRPG